MAIDDLRSEIARDRLAKMENGQVRRGGEIALGAAHAGWPVATVAVGTGGDGPRTDGLSAREMAGVRVPPPPDWSTGSAADGTTPARRRILNVLLSKQPVATLDPKKNRVIRWDKNRGVKRVIKSGFERLTPVRV